MARVSRKSLLHGLSGKLGGLVLRQVGGRTIASAAEGPGPRAPRSPRQQAHLDRMYRAQLYAKAQLLDPIAKARYATGIDARRTSAYTVAIADYMHSPRITALDVAAYRGQAGDPLLIGATDDFAVAAVRVRCCAATGAVLAAGPAVRQASGQWLFRAPHAHPLAPGTVLTVEAEDYPGNVAAHTHTF